MSEIPQRAETQGSTTFDPEKFFDAWAKEEITPPYDNDLRKFVIRAFGLKLNDSFVYRATAEVTLLQAQTYLEFGGQNGLHRWYNDGEGNERPAPPAIDIAAYNDIFRPTTNTANALKALGANAKKETIRMDVAKHLQSLYQPPAPERKITVPKNKSHVNPYFDVLAWANQNVEWAGPEATSDKIKISHALLPVLYHHFSCVCPSFEALEIIRLVAKGRPIADIGSGNGYWTYMLRRMKDGKKNLEVVPVDNGLSEWRTLWVPDTVEMDSAAWLKKHDNGKGHVMMLVYPQVGHDFTERTIKAYHGTTVVIAGTQNANGYTAFAKELLVDWFAREMPAWEKVCQVPLPSFAGKDEALFVYEKKA